MISADAIARALFLAAISITFGALTYWQVWVRADPIRRRPFLPNPTEVIAVFLVRLMKGDQEANALTEYHRQPERLLREAASARHVGAILLSAGILQIALLAFFLIAQQVTMGQTGQP